MRTSADPPHILPGDLPRPAALTDHAAVRERWAPWMKAEFKALAPVAVWIGGSRDLVSGTIYREDGSVLRFGHNRLARPVKVGTSESWRDTVTNRLDQTPFWWQGLLVRIWTESEFAAGVLSRAIIGRLMQFEETAQPLRKEFIDIGPDVSLDMLGDELLDTAHRLVLAAWDDDGLEAHLTALWKRKEAQRLARLGKFQGQKP